MGIISQEEVDELLRREAAGASSRRPPIPGCARKLLLNNLEWHLRETCPTCNDCYRIEMNGEIVHRIPRVRKISKVLYAVVEIELRDDQTFDGVEAEVRRTFPDARIDHYTRHSNTEYVL